MPPIAQGHGGIHADADAPRLGGKHVPVLPKTDKPQIAAGQVADQGPCPIIERLAVEERAHNVEQDECVDQAPVLRSFLVFDHRHRADGGAFDQGRFRWNCWSHLTTAAYITRSDRSPHR